MFNNNVLIGVNVKCKLMVIRRINIGNLHNYYT